jgi:tRNA threonylcarbamoyladenosine biosynthesis protein TsaE
MPTLDYTLEEINKAAQWLKESIGQHNIIALHGSMGAGKTTLVKAFCELLGVSNAVQSPTFTLVNEYTSTSGKTIYHFDFYRIDDPAEALDIGLYEYLDSGHLCMMEWPEKIEDLLDGEDLLNIYISSPSESTRRIGTSLPT